MPFPGVSCFCLTFARPKRLLEEAVESFLRQDYAGGKELLVLNDFASQTIRFEHPQVTVVNVTARFRTVGEKRNAAVALCRHDLLAPWDDDDICLPHRLSLSISRYDAQKRFYKPAQCFVLNNGVLNGPKGSGFHASALFHRSLFDEAGGYPHMNSGEDQEFERRFRATADPIEASQTFYVYRWAGTASYHLSGFGRGEDKVGGYAERALAEGRIESGEVRLEPHWQIDYCQFVNEYLAQKALGATP